MKELIFLLLLVWSLAALLMIKAYGSLRKAYNHLRKPENKITSNGGIRMYFAEYGRLSLVSQYTHHSCAFNSDRNLYDAAGVEVIWYFFDRRR